MMSYPKYCIKCGNVTHGIWNQICYICLFKKINEENNKVNKMNDQQKIQALSYALGLLRGTVSKIIHHVDNINEYESILNELKEVDKITERVLYKEN
jgi:hypothetical protein